MDKFRPETDKHLVGHTIRLFSEDPRHKFTPTTYFKVQCSSDDHLFLERLDMGQVFYSKNNTKRLKTHCTMKFKETMPKAYVSRILLEFRECKSVWWILRGMSEVAEEYDFYHDCIIAAANFIHLIYTEDSFYPKGEIDSQLNLLSSEMISFLGKKNCSFEDICNCVVNLTSNDQIYSAVKEPEIDLMVMSYYFCHNDVMDFANTFKKVYRELPKPEQVLNPIAKDVEDVISKMRASPSFTVDGYTRLLIRIAKRNALGAATIVYSQILEELIDTEAIKRLDIRSDPLGYRHGWTTKEILVMLETLMKELILRVQHKIRDQLLAVVRPMFRFHKCDSILIHPDVFEVIEVAELRRHVLGNRFIGRKHFLWAFYECCYGLPPKIRDSLVLNFSDECPPYHIYATAIQLAASFEEKRMELEHFVFAVLYSKDIDVSQVIEMQKHFKDFMEDVALDRMERPRSTPRPDILEDCLEGVVLVGRNAI